MNEHSTAAGRAPDGLENASELVELLGLAAYTELATFGLLATRSVDAPDLSTRQALVVVADHVLGRQRGLFTLAAERGLGPVEVMEPFDGALTDFDARTKAHTWWEDLLKGAVGHGLAADLCRTLAGGLPEADAAAVLAVLDDAPRDAAATDLVAAAAAGDAALASRLALWGRRVVGEALNLVQTVLAAHPALAHLAQRAGAGGAVVDGAAGNGEVPAWLLSRLTAEHTRRMDRMGLAA